MGTNGMDVCTGERSPTDNGALHNGARWHWQHQLPVNKTSTHTRTHTNFESKSSLVSEMASSAIIIPKLHRLCVCVCMCACVLTRMRSQTHSRQLSCNHANMQLTERASWIRVKARERLAHTINEVRMCVLWICVRMFHRMIDGALCSFSLGEQSEPQRTSSASERIICDL